MTVWFIKVFLWKLKPWEMGINLTVQIGLEKIIIIWFLLFICLISPPISPILHLFTLFFLNHIEKVYLPLLRALLKGIYSKRIFSEIITRFYTILLFCTIYYELAKNVLWILFDMLLLSSCLLLKFWPLFCFWFFILRLLAFVLFEIFDFFLSNWIYCWLKLL